MRLVKGARRRSLAIAAVFNVIACDSAPKPAAAMDCTEVLNRPREPRIVALDVDGALAPGPHLDSAAAVAGSDDTLAWREGQRIHLTVGSRSFDVDPPPVTLLHASSSLRGVMLGAHLVGVERIVEGRDVVELTGVDGSTRIAPMPAVPEGAGLGSPTAIAGGVMAFIGPAPKLAERRRVLVPFDPPPPAGTSWPAVDARTHASAGFIAPGERGAVVVDGKRIELGVPVTETADVQKLDDSWLVVDGPRHETLVQPARAPLEIDPALVELHMFSGGVYEIHKHTSPSIAIWRDGAWSTVVGGDAARDLSGTPLPHGAVVVRLETATHAGIVVAIERVQLETCNLDDRVFLVDVARRAVKLVASGGEKMRIHPMFAGGRFRFVEADVDSSLP